MKTYEEMVAAMISNSPERDTNTKENSDERALVRARTAKTRKYNAHMKSYSSKWEEDPNYRGWVHRSQRGDGHFFCLACKQHYTCGKSELDKHASSKKHSMNLKNMNWNEDFTINSTDNNTNMSAVSISSAKVDVARNDFVQELHTSSTSLIGETKEEALGRYIVSELRRIKNKKTYELVKWEILQALQKAMLQEVEAETSEGCKDLNSVQSHSETTDKESEKSSF